MELEKKENPFTKVLFGEQARCEVLEGIKIVAEAVSATMGPLGKNVIIQKDGIPHVTKDGISVAKAIRLKDRAKSLGAELIKESSDKTNTTSGDGTTATCVLTHALCQEGNKLATAGHSLVEMRNDIDKFLEKILKNLSLISTPVNNFEDIVRVATISANGDREIGELVSKAVETVGPDGMVSIEDAKSTKTTLDITKGIKLERGFLSPYFINNAEKNSCTLDDCYIFITDAILSSLQDILPLLEMINKAGKPLLIVAGDVEGQAIQSLVVNKLKGILNVCAITALGYDFGVNRAEALNDLCIATGAKFVPKDELVELLKKSTSSVLGRCKRIISTKNNTTIIVESKYEQAIKERIEIIKKSLEDPTLRVDEIKMLRDRILKLNGSAVVVRVGGITDIEINEKKDRIEDALCAAQAALEEGIVPGGGVALFHVSKILKEEPSSVVRTMMERVCTTPLRTIIKNAGGSPEVVANKLLDSDNNIGYDALKNEFGNMLEMGIIDPVKVVKNSISNACSVAKVFLSLSSAIIEE